MMKLNHSLIKIAPSILPNATLPSVPENTELESVASAINLNLASESSIPKKPTLAPPELYLNLIPLSRLSSEESSPISNTGSAIDTVVESTVVVVPCTVKLPVTVALPAILMFVDVISSELSVPPTVKLLVMFTLSGRPTVKVCPLALVSISFAVPWIVNDCESRSTAPVLLPSEKSKSCAVTLVST